MRGSLGEGLISRDDPEVSDEKKGLLRPSIAANEVKDQGKDCVEHTHDKILDKLQRKLDLDRAIPNWSQEYKQAKSPCQWIRLLKRIDDGHLK